MVCDVFCAYLSCNFLKDKLCCCIFKRRETVVAGIFADFDRYDGYVSGAECTVCSDSTVSVCCVLLCTYYLFFRLSLFCISVFCCFYLLANRCYRVK